MSSEIDILTAKAQDYEKYQTPSRHTWCSGCGNFGIVSGITRALVLENIQPSEVMFCFDVGCNGNLSDKFNTYTIHGLHGRVTALAPGITIANRQMHVLATAGDGSTLSEGINHLIHAVRNNYKMVFVLHNNNNYGLTTGQASSTTKPGNPMNGSPDGNLNEQLNVLQLILSINPTFVARSFSGDVPHITETVRKALHHNGFAFVEIMQTCPTYNKATPQEWYWDKIKYVENLENYDNTDIWQARKLVENLDNEIYLGLLYQKQDSLSYYDKLPHRKDVTTQLTEEVRNYDISELLKEFV